MVFNMFHGTLQPLAGAARTLSQLAEDGLLPRMLGVALGDRRAVGRDRPDRPAGDRLPADRRPGLADRRGELHLPDRHLPAERRRLAAAPQRAGAERPVPRAARDDRARRGRRGASGAARRCSASSSSACPTVLFGLALAYSGAGLYAGAGSGDRRRDGHAGFVALAAPEADRRDARRAGARRRRLPARRVERRPRATPLSSRPSRTSSSRSRCSPSPSAWCCRA